MEEHSRLKKIVDNAYYNRMNNLEVATGFKKGIIVNTLSTNEYESAGEQFHKINDYYKLLLIATKRVNGFWLNDMLPPEPKKNKKKQLAY